MMLHQHKINKICIVRRGYYDVEHKSVCNIILYMHQNCDFNVHTIFMHCAILGKTLYTIYLYRGRYDETTSMHHLYHWHRSDDIAFLFESIACKYQKQ